MNRLLRGHSYPKRLPYFTDLSFIIPQVRAPYCKCICFCPGAAYVSIWKKQYPMQGRREGLVQAITSPPTPPLQGACHGCCKESWKHLYSMGLLLLSMMASSRMQVFRSFDLVIKAAMGSSCLWIRRWTGVAALVI